MNVGEIVAIAGGVAGCLAAVAAFWQARLASQSQKAAEAASAEATRIAAESNAAWQRIATAQEIVAHAHRPKAWDVPKRTSGDHWVIRNTSGRAIRIDRIDVEPADASQLLEVMEELPARCRSGGLLEFYARERYTPEIRTITIVWRFEDESAEHHSTRTLTSARERSVRGAPRSAPSNHDS